MPILSAHQLVLTQQYQHKYTVVVGVFYNPFQGGEG